MSTNVNRTPAGTQMNAATNGPQTALRSITQNPNANIIGLPGARRPKPSFRPWRALFTILAHAKWLA